ncbi:MAG: hypothetical protein RI907_2042 [Pseudomonadota bacterium]|jgi:c-di-GMP-binding flagellar brake protein YcgR
MGAASSQDDVKLDDFRVTNEAEIQSLVRRLVDERCLVSLSGPHGDAFMTLVLDVDSTGRQITFSAEDGGPRLDALLEHGEVSAVAYLDRIKIQFDLDGLVHIQRSQGAQLRAQVPTVVYRFQRREAFRVQPLSQQAPLAHFRHPASPGVELHLRVLDISLGGVGLLLPQNVPMIPAGVKVASCRLELDDQTDITVSMVIHHVTAIQPQSNGVRLGCELLDVERHDRALGNYINQTQKRRAALALERR